MPFCLISLTCPFPSSPPQLTASGCLVQKPALTPNTQPVTKSCQLDLLTSLIFLPSSLIPPPWFLFLPSWFLACNITIISCLIFLPAVVQVYYILLAQVIFLNLTARALVLKTLHSPSMAVRIKPKVLGKVFKVLHHPVPLISSASLLAAPLFEHQPPRVPNN